MEQRLLQPLFTTEYSIGFSLLATHQRAILSVIDHIVFVNLTEIFLCVLFTYTFLNVAILCGKDAGIKTIGAATILNLQVVSLCLALDAWLRLGTSVRK